MQRTELLKTLDKVRPALSTRDFLPIMSHYCFTGDSVFAYNDTMAISAPCETGFAGGVRGDTLMAFLSNTGAKELSMSVKDSALNIKAGASRVQLPILPEEEFIWDGPDMEEYSIVVPINEDFVKGLGRSLMTAGTAVGYPELGGVTFCFGDICTMLSSMDRSISRYTLDMGGIDELRVVFGTEFCKVWHAFCEKYLSEENKAALYVNEYSAVIQFDDGTVLCGKALMGDKGYDIEGLSAGYAEYAKSDVKPLPKLFAQACKRSAAFAAMEDGAAVKMTVSDGTLMMETRTKQYGNIRDRMKFAADFENTINLNPQQLVKFSSFSTHMYVDEDFIVLSAGEQYYAVLTTVDSR